MQAFATEGHEEADASAKGGADVDGAAEALTIKYWRKDM